MVLASLLIIKEDNNLHELVEDIKHYVRGLVESPSTIP